MVQLGLDAVLSGTPATISKTKVSLGSAVTELFRLQLFILFNILSMHCRSAEISLYFAQIATWAYDLKCNSRKAATNAFMCTSEGRPCRPKRALMQVVCTLGPVSRSVEVLEELLKAGMSVARFNFSHGSHDYHQVGSPHLRVSPSLVTVFSC